MVFGRDNKLFKWKENNTIDFMVKKKTKIYLYYYKKTLTAYKSFKADTPSYKLISDFVNGEFTDQIIEFKISSDLETFTPYKLRTDKNRPNGEITVLNTIKNIQENIQDEELFNEKTI